MDHLKTEKSDHEGLSEPTPATSRETGVEVQHFENPRYSEVRLGARRKLRHHCARFWLFWLIGVTVFLAIFLPCLFLKIIPAAIQNMIDRTDLPILNAQMGAASETELHLSFSTVFKAPGGLTARMDSFKMYLYNNFTEGYYPYTSVNVPAQTLKGSTPILINSTTPVLNDTEISKWLNKTFYAETTEISFRGRTTVHVGALHASVNIQKTVLVPGLNQLSGFTLDNAQLVVPAEADGTNLEGNLTLPNPSSVAIQFGTLVFNASVADVFIGNITVSDVTLQHGNNTIPFRGQLLLDAVVGNLGAAADGTLEMAIRGNRCLVDGQDITYVEEVLNNTVLNASVPLGQLI